MKPTIRIAQLTDCHLMSSPEQDYRGKDAHQSLQRLMQSVREFAPELLLATGDLSEDASPASYKALQANFEPLGIPVLALPGNHDDPALLAKTFNGSPVGNVEISQHGNWQIIRLDSTLQGTIAGRINTDSIDDHMNRIVDGNISWFSPQATSDEPGNFCTGTPISTSGIARPWNYSNCILIIHR